MSGLVAMRNLPAGRLQLFYEMAKIRFRILFLFDWWLILAFDLTRAA